SPCFPPGCCPARTKHSDGGPRNAAPLSPGKNAPVPGRGAQNPDRCSTAEASGTEETPASASNFQNAYLPVSQKPCVPRPRQPPRPSGVDRTGLEKRNIACP